MVIHFFFLSTIVYGCHVSANQPAAYALRTELQCCHHLKLIVYISNRLDLSKEVEKVSSRLSVIC